MGGNCCSSTANAMGLLGSVLNLASVSSSSWTSSSVASSGLYKKCILYPGQEVCSEIAESTDLSSIRSRAIATTVFAFIATAISCTAGDKVRRKTLASTLYFISVITGYSSGTSYKNSFSLCAGASYGNGFRLMMGGATFNLFATILIVVSMFLTDAAEDEEVAQGYDVKKSKFRAKTRFRIPKKFPSRLKRLSRSMKPFKKRKRKDIELYDLY